ncbi:NAD(P)-dependent oxidoreductase [Cobetia sp. UCD-24C]|uniref:NAD(P)-dependent oxidoreductase n=1 Tax=Cobetia sp. UCD-24C TaxID=1716176 RepID=UPI0006CA5DC1|nr:NAD-binding protein [Cobetia sp. UCD-24C]
MKICVIGDAPIGTRAIQTLAHAGVEGVMAVAAPEGPVASHSSFSAEIYLMALATSQQVQKVLTGKQGLLRRAPPGSTVIDLCSGDITLSRELAVQTRLAGHHWLEAATSRNPADEANDSLTLLIGSDEATVTRMTALLDIISTQHLHVGDAGCGHAAALASDYLHAAHLITTAEAVAMAYRAGVTPQACIDAINLGAGRSAVSEVNFPRWVLPGRYDSGISTGQLRRDLRLARSFVTTLNLPEGLMKAVFERCQPPELCPADEDDLHHLCDRWLSKVPAQLPPPRLTETRAPRPQALAISALPDADR